MVTRNLFLVIVVLLSACAAPAPAATPVLRAPAETPLPAPSVTSVFPPAPSSTQATLASTIPPVTMNVRVTDTNDYEFPQLLPFDGIPPIYDPQFASAADAPLLDDELVMGVALGGEAKAYPVTVLHFREMVDDELVGVPILVTW